MNVVKSQYQLRTVTLYCQHGKRSLKECKVNVPCKCIKFIFELFCVKQVQIDVLYFCKKAASCKLVLNFTISLRVFLTPG